MKTAILKLRASMMIMITGIIIFLAVPQLVNAQTAYKVLPAKDVLIKILGSSNVHDWAMAANGVDSRADFKLDGEQLTGLTSLNLIVEAKSLKSEHTAMDDRTYKTIKADQFPKITYKLLSAVVSPVAKNKYLIKAKGDLTIAGATQNVNMDVTAVVNADNTITCTGSHKLQLTEYKIDPPSFMLGAMKVKNDLTIQFNLVYKK